MTPFLVSYMMTSAQHTPYGLPFIGIHLEILCEAGGIYTRTKVSGHGSLETSGFWHIATIELMNDLGLVR